MTEGQVAIFISIILGIPSIILSIIATNAQVGARKDAQKEFKKTGENGLKIQEEYYGLFGDGLILDYTPELSIDYLEKTERIISSRPLLKLTITNLSRTDTVILSPFLIGEMINIVKIPDNANYFQPIKDGIGGGSDPDYFECVLSPSQKNIFPMPCLDNNDKLKFEYFELKAIETEYFEINFHIEPGFLYRYRIGVIYKENGKNKILWVKKTFQNAIPVNPKYFKRYETSWEHTWSESKLLELSEPHERSRVGINFNSTNFQKKTAEFQHLLEKHLVSFSFPKQKDVQVLESDYWNKRFLGQNFLDSQNRHEE